MPARLAEGVYTALVTPFDSNGEVNYSLFAPLLQWQRERGVTGVVVGGTTGEGFSMSVEERERAIAVVREYADGLVVVASTGCVNLPETQRLSRFAEREGCDAILVVSPFYYKQVPEQGLVEYFRRVLDVVQLPTLLYNYPELAGVHITPVVVDAILEYPHFAGLKDSSGKWETVLTFLLRFPRLQVFTGAETLLADTVAAGGAGCISGLANAFPELITRLYFAACQQEDTAVLANQLQAISAVVDAAPYVAAVKQICEWRGLPRMAPRPPLLPLSEEQASELRRNLDLLEAI